jgi:ABC-type phosphate/phosphonate transport system substrate-binding protein
MIASLAMYDRPETRSATDRFWALIRDGLRVRGIAAPDALETANPFMETWTDPELVFSQTCGRPFRLGLHETTQLVGTPDFGLADCPPGYYRSALVVRARDPRTTLQDFGAATFAYNGEDSQSGWSAPLVHAEARGIRFADRMNTGSHVASAKAVARGEADIAGLDAMTWDLIKRYEECASNLRVLDWTVPTPGLPYITAMGQPAERIAEAVAQAIEALDLHDRMLLRLKGLVRIPAETYLAVPNPT